MKVISFNANGIRAASRKGFFEWLEKQNADVVCFKEIKADKSQLTDQVFRPKQYYHFFSSARKKGYSGVALYCKKKPDRVLYGLGWDVADLEGRYIQVDFSGLSIASIYLPSGTTGDKRQEIKYSFLNKYLAILKKQICDDREYIICGDFNIAHKNIDLKNWKNNKKNSGFLPEERSWLDTVLCSVGYIDAFRYKNVGKEQYTWWSNRAQAWNNNVGWRIDYHLVTPGLAEAIQETSVYTEEKFSDHAPLIINYLIE